MLEGSHSIPRWDGPRNGSILAAASGLRPGQCWGLAACRAIPRCESSWTFKVAALCSQGLHRDQLWSQVTGKGDRGLDPIAGLI
jgi:hypothetical protein